MVIIKNKFWLWEKHEWWTIRKTNYVGKCFANFIMNVKETSNDEIMKMLEKQNREYLDEILARLDKFEEN